MSTTTINLYGQIKHQGLPVAQMLVTLYDHFTLAGGSGNSHMQTRTDSRGDFVFSVKPGLYKLEVLPEISQGTRFLSQAIEEIKIVSSTTVNIALATGCVVDGEILAPEYRGELLGQLFEGIEVVAMGIEPSSYKADCPLDKSGKFSLVLPRGRYNFVLRARAGAHKFNFLSTRATIIDIAKDCTIALDLPELQGFGGDVVDFFNQPCENALVTLKPSLPDEIARELNLISRTRTTSSGRFQFAVLQGYYDLEIEAAPDSVLFGLSEKRVYAGPAAEGEERDNHYILLEGHRLRGQVNFEGRLLTQALVRACSITTDQEFTTRTDDEGQFMLSVPAGSYKILVSAHPKDAPSLTIDDVSYASLAPFVRSVVVGGDTHVSIKLKQGTALMGRVCDDAGQSRPGVNISIFSEQSMPEICETLPAESEALLRGITDGEGHYCVFLSPGKYSLVLQRDMASRKRFEIKDEPLSLDVVWHGWSQMRFVVTGTDGKPVSRCRLMYCPYGHEQERDYGLSGSGDDLAYPHGYVVTHDDGGCRLTLPTGVYTFKFIPPLAGSYQAKVIRQLSVSADLTRKVILPLKEDTDEEA